MLLQGIEICLPELLRYIEFRMFKMRLCHVCQIVLLYFPPAVPPPRPVRLVRPLWLPRVPLPAHGQPEPVPDRRELGRVRGGGGGESGKLKRWNWNSWPFFFFFTKNQHFLREFFLLTRIFSLALRIPKYAWNENLAVCTSYMTRDYLYIFSPDEKKLRGRRLQPSAPPPAPPPPPPPAQAEERGQGHRRKGGKGGSEEKLKKHVNNEKRCNVSWFCCFHEFFITFLPWESHGLRMSSRTRLKTFLLILFASCAFPRNVFV